jgi:hypothetical protein
MMKLFIAIIMMFILSGCIPVQDNTNAIINCTNTTTTLIEYHNITTNICDPCTNTTIYKDVIVYKNATDKERADWYISIANSESKGYYDDFINEKYVSCQHKLEFTRDYVFTAVGLYNRVNETKLADAYSVYNEAENIIYKFCRNQPDDSIEYDRDVLRNYDKKYASYEYRMEELDRTKIFER